MKIFLKITKIIFIVLACVISFYVIRSGIKVFEMSKGMDIINDDIFGFSTIIKFILLFIIRYSVIGLALLIFWLVKIFPNTMRYISKLEKNPELCTKNDILRLVSYLIIITIIIGTIIYVYIKIH